LFEREILATFQQQISTLRTRSVRESRLTNQVRDLRNLFDTEVVPEIAAQRRRRETGQRLVPEFHSGGFNPREQLAVLLSNEVVLTQGQQSRMLAMAGFNIFAAAGVPNAGQINADGSQTLHGGGTVQSISRGAPIVVNLFVENEVSVGEDAATRILVTGARTSFLSCANRKNLPAGCPRSLRERTPKLRDRGGGRQACGHRPP